MRRETSGDWRVVLGVLLAAAWSAAMGFYLCLLCAGGMS